MFEVQPIPITSTTLAVIIIRDIKTIAQMLDIPQDIANKEAIRIVKEETDLDFSSFLDIMDGSVFLTIKEISQRIGTTPKKLKEFLNYIGWQKDGKHRKGNRWNVEEVLREWHSNIKRDISVQNNVSGESV